jgi:hypothetical protein
MSAGAAAAAISAPPCRASRKVCAATPALQAGSAGPEDGRTARVPVEIAAHRGRAGSDFRCGRPPLAASIAHRPTPPAGADQHPLLPGLGNFAAQRSRGMARRDRGKFLLNDAGATRQGPRRPFARQERMQWVRRSSAKETAAKTGRLKGATRERRLRTSRREVAA